jgi:ABC-type transporter Mla MlaB component
MNMYQHDSATMFRFVLRGELAGDRVKDLEHAWNTAKSIIAGKQLVIDISGITYADAPGVDLLSRMRESGACLTAVLAPESSAIFPRSGVPMVAPRGQHGSGWAFRFLRLAGLGE